MQVEKKESDVTRTDYNRSETARPEDDNHHNETEKWLDSVEYLLEYVLKNKTSEAPLLVERLIERLRESGVKVPSIVNTPYINTIAPEKETPYPGDREIERR
ncbi:MAG TPA: hypothetical protein VGH16_19835, partial [Candidatus Binatia bacterium]